MKLSCIVAVLVCCVTVTVALAAPLQVTALAGNDELSCAISIYGIAADKLEPFSEHGADVYIGRLRDITRLLSILKLDPGQGTEFLIQWDQLLNRTLASSPLLEPVAKQIRLLEDSNALAVIYVNAVSPEPIDNEYTNEQRIAKAPWVGVITEDLWRSPWHLASEVTSSFAHLGATSFLVEWLASDPKSGNYGVFLTERNGVLELKPGVFDLFLMMYRAELALQSVNHFDPDVIAQFRAGTAREIGDLLKELETRGEQKNLRYWTNLLNLNETTFWQGSWEVLSDMEKSVSRFRKRKAELN